MARLDSAVSYRDGLLYIDGEWRQSSTNQRFTVDNPATGSKIGTAEEASVDDVDSAVSAARRAFDDGPWGQASPAERQRVLANFADIMERRKEELISLNIEECGSVRSFAEAMQVGGAIAHLRTTIEAMGSFEWEVPLSPHFGNGVGQGVILREGFGVAALISAYNFPLWLNITKLAPALAAGCSVILKPASPTPYEGLILAEVGEEAGLPSGVLNVLTGGRVMGQALTEHEGVDIVSFTGSNDVGREVYRQATGSFKKVVLELGGKSPNIVLEDADLDKAVAAVVAGTTKQAGQGCSLLTRTLVHNSIREELVERVRLELEAVRVGDPAESETDMGPLISEAQLAKVEELIESGLSEGATLVTGGNIPAGLENGYYMAPTLFNNVKSSMRIAQEEFFGPVNVVIGFDTDEEAVEIANDSVYGLSAAVNTQDPVRAFAIAKKIRSGGVILNGGGGSAPNTHVPFGGYKASGLGREYGAWGIDEYLETKAVSWGVSGH